MLLNEFLKEHRKVQELKAVAATQAVAITQHQSTISELKATVAKQQDTFASKIAQQQQQIERACPVDDHSPVAEPIDFRVHPVASGLFAKRAAVHSTSGFSSGEPGMTMPRWPRPGIVQYSTE